VFITSHGDETVRPRVLEDGAWECLFKPFSEKALLDAVLRRFGDLSVCEVPCILRG